MEDLELPDYPYDAMAGLVLDAEAASAFEPLVAERPGHRLTAPEDRVGGYAGQVVLAATTCGPSGSGARRRPPWTACCRGWTPSPRRRFRPWPGRSICRSRQGLSGVSGWHQRGGAANLCGVPALFLMNGTGEAGLPTSLQLTGRALTEATLLEIGMHYQARTKFHRQRPPGL